MSSSRQPRECQYCGSGNLTKNVDDDWVCEVCGMIVKHTDSSNEVPYLQ